MSDAEHESTAEEIFAPVADRAGAKEELRHVLEEILELAVELAREGREGRKVGTLFVVGDVDAVLLRSRQLVLDPFFGHPRESLRVESPGFRETVKEFAQIDGAFIVDEEGVFVSAGRYIDIDFGETANFLPGLGTRNAAAASITRATGATAIVVSQSSIVRVFADGKVRAEIIPELFLMSEERVFTPHPDVRQIPDAGITVAVAGDDV